MPSIAGTPGKNARKKTGAPATEGDDRKNQGVQQQRETNSGKKN
jgi:hypothetical protein